MLLRGARWRWHLRQSSIVYVTLSCDLLSAHRQRTPTVFPITLSLNSNSLAPSLPPSLRPSPPLSFSLSRMQFKHGESIFSCAQWGLHGDVEETVAPGVKTVQVHDDAGDFHFAKRKTAGTRINTGMFVQIWKLDSCNGEIW